MKPFDLEKALAGEPVVLRNGSKAFIAKSIPTEHVKKEGELIGYLVEDSKFHSCATWTKDGKYNPYFSSHIYDIIGMYEEPRPTVTLTLPCPIQEPQEGMWFIDDINSENPIGKSEYTRNNHMHWMKLNHRNLYLGVYFASKEDAQAWLDAMKNARR
ncbi:pyruvate kinase [Pasteurella multocida]